MKYFEVMPFYFQSIKEVLPVIEFEIYLKFRMQVCKYLKNTHINFQKARNARNYDINVLVFC